jgi:hypothetical protein
MKHANSPLRRLGGALGLVLLLALFMAPGCGDDASGSQVPDAAEHDGAPAIDARSPIDATPVDADPNAPDAAPESCGGFTGEQCKDRENTFCDFEANSCGDGDATGVCKPRPDICQPVVMEVCGCDGETYANECEAQLAGTDLASEGACVR